MQLSKTSLFRSRRRTAIVTGVAVAAAVALGVTLIQGPTAEAEGQEHPWSQPDGTSHVTLITGDRVTIRAVNGQTAPEVDPADGRDAIKFRIFNQDDNLYVVPSDAEPLIAQGALDLRLFDMSTLVEQGYADADRDDIPLIVRGGDGFGTADTQSTQLNSLGVATAKQPKSSASEFWSATTGAGTLSSGATEIWLDGKREVSLDVSVPQVGAPEAWDAGYTGDGSTIAVLDTGVDAEHPDIADKIVEAVDFTGGDDVSDTVGHGTHVASTIAGSGAASDGSYQGVAPDADLLVGKVCGDIFCDESAILAGMEWAAESGATAANLSLGGSDTPEIDPLEQAVNDLTEQYGTLFVIAAGNDGGDETVGSPGSADAALTVGAVDKSDELADFSSRGPRVGDHALKPDITAPGVDIVAAKAAGTEMGEPVGDDYVTASGTSMATPHVAGAVAILAQQNPDWTPAQLKAALMASAEPNADLMAHEQGAGRLDVARAVSQQVTADPAGVSVGLVEWPQDGDPSENTVTYSNPSDEAVTLNLAAEATGPEGEPVDGVVSVDTDTVEVPAGGEAEVTVTTDVTGDIAYGYYSGVITATSGDLRVVTPVAATKEPESYSLTVEAIGRDGNPVESFMLHMMSISGETDGVLEIVEGSSIELRVPVDEYHIEVTIDSETDEGYESTLLVDTSRTVSEDAAVTFDANDAGAVSVSIHDKTVGQSLGAYGYVRDFDGQRGIGMTILGSDLDGVFSHQYGDPVTEGRLVTEIQGSYSDGDAPESQADREVTTVYSYALAEEGIPTGYEAALTADDFAQITNNVRSTGEEQQGQKALASFSDYGGMGVGYTVPLPTTITEYFTPSDHFSWDGEFSVVEEADDGWLDPVTYEVRGPFDLEPGDSVEQDWNTAVFGPGFTAGTDWALREESDLFVALPLYSGPGTDNVGDSLTDEATTALYAGDELIGESDVAGLGEFTGLPAELTDYRLVVEADRSSISDLTTRLECEWTFSSTSGDSTVPLLAVRFGPEGLDETNHAEAGSAVTVPVTVQTITGEVIAPAELAVEVSFDGETWEEAAVEDGAITVTAESAGTVSLRVSAADDDGNTVTQTIVDAYGVK